MAYSLSNTLIRLSLHAGIGPVLINYLISMLTTDAALEELWQLSAVRLAQRFAVSAHQAGLIHAALRDAQAWQRCERWQAKNKSVVVTTLDNQYPVLLKQTPVPPPVLWLHGALLPASYRGCALVGARRATAYGQRVVKRLVPSLVEHHIITVSGGAVGVDGWVHEQTIQAGGHTVVVAGCGLMHCYPREHAALFDRVVQQGGTIISPFAPWQEPTKGTFPARNRIIAGLADVSVVVQAAARSGALITASYALEYNREVAAVPGSIEEPLCGGSNQLLAQGAVVVTDADALLRLFGQQEEKNTKPVEEELPENVWQLLALLESPQTFDDLCAAGHTDPSQLRALLYELQVAGKIIQDYAGFWERCG